MTLQLENCSFVQIYVFCTIFYILDSKKKPEHKLYVASTLKRREKKYFIRVQMRGDGGDEEKAHVMADEFECEVGAGEECAEMMKVINSNA